MKSKYKLGEKVILHNLDTLKVFWDESNNQYDIPYETDKDSTSYHYSGCEIDVIDQLGDHTGIIFGIDDCYDYISYLIKLDVPIKRQGQEYEYVGSVTSECACLYDIFADPGSDDSICDAMEIVSGLFKKLEQPIINTKTELENKQAFHCVNVSVHPSVDMESFSFETSLTFNEILAIKVMLRGWCAEGMPGYYSLLDKLGKLPLEVN